MEKLKLYMIMLGCKPAGRHTEQHDIFFAIASSLKETIPYAKAFWPEAQDNMHLDAWREVTHVDGYEVIVVPKVIEPEENKLFFINLGGYRAGEFDEPHYKLLVVAPDLASATKQAKQTAFFKHTGFTGANAHIDDKYGVDVDDVYQVEDILPAVFRKHYSLSVKHVSELPADELHLGYFKLKTILG
ncbi:hypothetical protein IWX76_001685 [Pedobacter sp. CAN_A7]|uniref:DUF1543 domain-containing protein n=1 Tax=Pedobacter sp. CAN_A7 TaxID=2787722 RepID=UPI0018CBE2D9